MSAVSSASESTLSFNTQKRLRSHQPCTACHRPLNSTASYVTHNADERRASYHLDCLPCELLLSLCPDGDYSKLQHWPAQQPLLSEATAALNRLLLSGYQQRQAASSSLWYHDPDLFLDSAAIDRLTCAVCQHVLTDPVELPYEGAHLLCETCWMILRLSSSPSSSSSSTQVSCPHCRDQVAVSQVHHSRVTKRSIEFEQRLRCHRHVEGCEAVMSMGKQGVHCQQHELHCLPTPCDDCGASVSRSQLQRHQEVDCFFTCAACGERVAGKEREAHLEACEPTLCINTARCPHACSAAVMRRDAMDQHLLLCQSLPIRCHERECEVLHPRAELHRYVADNIASIYPQLLQELSESREREGERERAVVGRQQPEAANPETQSQQKESAGLQEMKRPDLEAATMAGDYHTVIQSCVNDLFRLIGTREIVIDPYPQAFLGILQGAVHAVKAVKWAEDGDRKGVEKARRKTEAQLERAQLRLREMERQLSAAKAEMKQLQSAVKEREEAEWKHLMLLRSLNSTGARKPRITREDCAASTELEWDHLLLRLTQSNAMMSTAIQAVWLMMEPRPFSMAEIEAVIKGQAGYTRQQLRTHPLPPLTEILVQGLAIMKQKCVVDAPAV
jgi:hypothetical protein